MTYLDELTKANERLEAAKGEQFASLVNLIKEAAVFTAEDTAKAMALFPPSSFLATLGQTGRTFEELIAVVEAHQ